MSIRDSNNNKKVTFNMQDGLEAKIDRLTVMMSKLVANKEGINKAFKPQIYQNRRRGQTRNFYNRCNYQNRYRLNSGDRRRQFSGRIQYEQNYRGRSRNEQDFRNDFRRGNFRGNARMHQNQNVRGPNNRSGYRGNHRSDNYERDRSRYRERSYSGNFRRNDRSTSGLMSGSRPSTNRDRNWCYKCREYNHFAKD